MAYCRAVIKRRVVSTQPLGLLSSKNRRWRWTELCPNYKVSYTPLVFF
jgi:hypothetical protein